MSDHLYLKHSPLNHLHLEHNARMTAFTGWSLPLHYGSIIAEHNYTRKAASLFDISHMGEIIIEGTTAEEELNRLFTRDIKQIPDNSCRYGFMLNNDGFTIDDLILYRFSKNKFMAVVNSSRIDEDFEWLLSNLSSENNVINISDETVKLDLQGPESLKAISHIFNSKELQDLKRFAFTDVNYENFHIIISRTGYTGEDGFELYIPVEAGGLLWTRFLENSVVKPAGLGARDSLRLEKGYSLYGHELSLKISPSEANLMKFVDIEKDFIGKKALTDIENKGPDVIITPFICEGRQTARDDYEIYLEERRIGIVTSGCFSPVLKKGIGLALLDRQYYDKKLNITCVNENTIIKAEIARLPFV